MYWGTTCELSEGDAQGAAAPGVVCGVSGHGGARGVGSGERGRIWVLDAGSRWLDVRGQGEGYDSLWVLGACGSGGLD